VKHKSFINYSEMSASSTHEVVLATATGQIHSKTSKALCPYSPNAGAVRTLGVRTAPALGATWPEVLKQSMYNNEQCHVGILHDAEFTVCNFHT